MKRITLSHGSGGKLMHDLVKGLFIKELKNPFLSRLDDAAGLMAGGQAIMLTTDSYVVNPLFFPGGDIGKLSIYGTVNDLAVCGAKPLYISVGMIVEEGFEMSALRRLTLSIKEASKRAGIHVVTGDFKVVGRGQCDKLFINTSGVGIKLGRFDLSLDRIRKGDKIIISGPIGQHGVSILAARNDLNFASKVKSDCAPTNGLIRSLLRFAGDIRFMRDPTRGGLATTLNEFVEGRGFGILIHEDKLPVSAGVRSVCELLGFEPLYMANEGRVVMIVSDKASAGILRAMKGHTAGKASRIIGEVVAGDNGTVCMKTRSGGLRLLKMLTGEQLPRIC